MGFDQDYEHDYDYEFDWDHDHDQDRDRDCELGIGSDRSFEESGALNYSDKLAEAFAWAAELHRSQRRKGTRIAYVAHLMAVASIALEHGGGETEAIAALLHDAIEDQAEAVGGAAAMRAEIDRRFGRGVREIVDACTDAEVQPKPPWRERKEAYIAHLAGAAPGALLVSAADKLHNARAILGDYRAVGEALWSRFKGGREGTLWYYRSLVEAFQATDAPIGLIDELQRVVDDLHALAGDGAGGGLV